MLVHMTPREVQGLQSLAMAHGGSLTVNPKTGLPEAGFLDNFLPTVLGIGATILSDGAISPWMAGLGVGGIAALQSGSLMKGLSAGLGAYGGAGLTGAFAGFSPEQVSALTESPEALSAKEFAANAATAPGTSTPPAPTPYEAYAKQFPADTSSWAGTTTPPAPPASTATVADVPFGNNAEMDAYRQTVEREMLGDARRDITYPTPTQPTSYIDRVTSGVSKAMDKPLDFIKANKGLVASAALPLAYSGLQSIAAPKANAIPTVALPSKGHIRPYDYTVGQYNPNFGQQGQSYYLGQGYTAQPIFAAAGGGMVPSPNDNVNYPMSNLASGKAGFNVQSSPSPNEVVGGYDARIDPMTGAQLFDSGGSVYNDPPRPGFVQFAAPFIKQGGDPTKSAASMHTAAPDQSEGIKSLTDSQLALAADESDDAIIQGLAAKEQMLRQATRRAPKSAYTKGLAGGGVLSQLGIEYAPAQQRSQEMDYYYNPDDQTYTEEGMAAGGIASLPEYAAGGKLLHGAGDGMSDDIPAVIKGKTNQRAALADGEFVIPADVVSHLGNGSTEAGAKRLYGMMSKVRKARTGNPKQGKQIQAEKYMPA